jgi:hypothetical protein
MPARLIRAAHLYAVHLCRAPHAYASVAPPGSLVFTAGACPVDETGAKHPAGEQRLQDEHGRVRDCCLRSVRLSPEWSGAACQNLGAHGFQKMA